MEATSSSTTTVKPLSKWMRLMLLTSSILPFLAGLSLFIGTSQTEEFAAWTIKSEITAATIGAAYWAGLWLTLLAGLERTWAKARVAVAPVLVFSVGNLIAVLLDLDIFHTDSDSAGIVFVTYLWLVPYFVGPLLMAWLLAIQLRVPGGDPPREDPLSPAIRAVLVVQGVVLLGVGAALFIAPVDTSDAIWPWPMLELSGRVIGIWLLAFAAGVFAVLRENDYSRVLPRRRVLPAPRPAPVRRLAALHRRALARRRKPLGVHGRPRQLHRGGRLRRQPHVAPRPEVAPATA